MPLKAVSIVSPSIPDDRKCRVWSSGFAAISLPWHRDTRGHRTPSLPPGHRWARLIQTLCGEIKVKCDTIKQFVLSAVIVIITLLGITQSGASTMGKCCDITIILSYLFHWSLSETHLLNMSHLIWFFLPKNFPNWSEDTGPECAALGSGAIQQQQAAAVLNIVP